MKGYLFINDDDFMKVWEFDTVLIYLVIIDYTRELVYRFFKFVFLNDFEILS